MPPSGLGPTQNRVHTVSWVPPALPRRAPRTTPGYAARIIESRAAAVKRSETIDRDAFVAGKALDSPLQGIGDQENQIRARPVARSIERLREVFATK